MRLAPPSVVSPLTLALAMRQPGRSARSFASARATQPCAGDSPYAADNESPNTSTVRAGFAAAAAAANAGDPIAHSSANRIASVDRPGAFRG